VAAQRRCLVCGHVGLRPHLEILLQCPTCEFVTAGADPSVDIKALYAGDYFRGDEYLDYQADEAFFRKTFRAHLQQLLRRRAHGRLLEVGCAYGFFLALAQEHFDVVGFEVNQEAVRYGRDTLGLDVRSDDFLAASVTSIGGPVDVTVMRDVVEHLERPDLFIAHVADLSRPHALLSITTGDIGSAVARWRGRKWRLIHPPTHLHYFSRATLTRLLANHGFRVLDIRTMGVARSVHQVLYSILVLRMGRTKTYEALTRVVPATLGFTLNTFDIMHVLAERVADGRPADRAG